MSQVSPFLKPIKPTPGGGGGSGDNDDAPSGGGGGTPEYGERNALNVPMMPLVGFWRRVGAMALDLVALFIILRFAGAIFRDTLQPLGTLTPHFGTAFFLAYFFLSESPLGKGRTVGKLLAGIRVTDLDGNVPGFGRALLRTLIFFIGIVIGDVLMRLALDSNNFLSVRLELVRLIFVISFYFATTIAIVFNPFRQGPHDHLSKTLVRPATAPRLSFDELCAIIGPNWRRYYKQPQIMAGATVLLLTLFFGFTVYRSDALAAEKTQFDLKNQLLAEYGFTQVESNHYVLPLEGDPADESIRTAFFTEARDPESVSGMKLLLRLQSPTTWPVDDPALESRVQAFGEEYLEQVIRGLPPEVLFGETEDGATFTNLQERPFGIEIELYEYLNIFFTVAAEKVETFEVPAPAEASRTAPDREPAEEAEEASSESPSPLPQSEGAD